jgi:hypothetical protein
MTTPKNPAAVEYDEVTLRLINERCDCVLSVRGATTCFRCHMLAALAEQMKGGPIEPKRVL